MTRRFGASPIAPFRLALGALAGASLALSACSERESVTIDYSGPVAGWSHVGGNLGGQRYSPLTQIDRSNVGVLEEAWRFESGDVTPTTSLQVTPILVDDQLVLCTPRNQVIALDEALERLGQQAVRLAQTVEMRFFGGLTIEETAIALDVAPSTVQLDWQKARAWLHRELQAD